VNAALSVPLFDTLAHPTLTGDWFGRGLDASFETLVVDLEEHGFVGACAVGLAGIEGYDHARFLSACRRFPQLYPVAGVDVLAEVDAEAEFVRLRRMGYRAIKIHPRYCGAATRLDLIGPMFEAAARVGLIVFYCTYMHGPIGSYPSEDPLYALVRLLKRVPQLKVVLLHGGDVGLMRYAELVRFNPNLLLDLSLTMMKYRGSSIDADLRFLFQSFDRRVCIGSDHPEYGHGEIRERFEELAVGLSLEKLENVGCRNLLEFIEHDSTTNDEYGER